MEKILVVGGFARDLYLGHNPKDMDFVVVGMSEAEFQKLYPDSQRIGKKFPCFKIGGEDYAFARAEESTGPGHNDFDTVSHPEVTLEEDLNRRDLTINTACVCPETGEFFLLEQAKADLDDKVLRHVSDAFKEDPLRVFRLARFAAKFPKFVVAPETFTMCQSMTDLLPFIDKERICYELVTALKEDVPARFFWVLGVVGAMKYWFTELQDLAGVPAGPEEFHPEGDAFLHSLGVLMSVSELTDSPTTRWAAMCHDLGKAITPKEEWPAHRNHDKAGAVFAKILGDRLGLPKIYTKAAMMACEEHMRFNKLVGMKPGKAVRLLEKLNRFPGGITEFIRLVTADGINQGVEELALAAQEVFQLKLPEKHRNRGLISQEILLELRAREFGKIRMAIMPK